MHRSLGTGENPVLEKYKLLFKLFCEQKEALDVFDEDLRRKKLAQELEEREKRLQERQKKLIEEQKKLQQEKQARHVEKLEQIQETDRLYREKKNKQKGALTERLENKYYSLSIRLS